jgi:hypothetical protein
MIGNRIGLKIDDNFYFKSLMGGMFTITLAVLSIAAAISFGLQIVSKTNAKVILDYSYQEWPYINLTDNNFPIIVNVGKRGGISLTNFTTYYNMTIINVNNIPINGKPVVLKTYRRMRVCQDEDFLGRKPDFLAVANPPDSSLYFCLEKGQKLELLAILGTSKLNYLTVLINRCVNGTDIICKPKEVIDTEFKSMIVNFYVGDYYFDSQNYTDPGQAYFKLFNFEITSDYYKRNYIYYRNVDYLTDRGLIFEETLNNSYYQVDSFKEQIYLNKDYAYTPDTIAEVTLTLVAIKNKYLRSYYKFQQLAADVGGVMKTFILIINFLHEFMNRCNVNYTIVNETFDLSKPEMDDSLNNSKAPNLTVKFNRIPVNDNVSATYELRPEPQTIYSKRQKKDPPNFFSYTFCRSKSLNKLNDFNRSIINVALDVKNVIKSMNEIQILKSLILSKDEKNLFIYLRRNYFYLGNFPREKFDYDDAIRDYDSISSKLKEKSKKLLNLLKEENNNMIFKNL